jgi:hypothetical protein
MAAAAAVFGGDDERCTGTQLLRRFYMYIIADAP